MISRIIKVEVSVISQSQRLRLITLTETLIIPDITKTSSNNCLLTTPTMFSFANVSPFEQTYGHRATSFSLLEGLCYYNYVFYLYRTKSASGPKPVPLLPRNREENKENHTVLKIRILYTNCVAIQYTRSIAWSHVTENFF